ncbi:MAG: DNA translocase FtsK [Desulfobacterales bacterium]|nr:DNA translocase FtsK [Desulfobacterales bacterium]
MRKELTGLFLFFLVIFTIASLLSYSPADPAFNNAKAPEHFNNLFGQLGAYVADILIKLMFGIGAFWIPVLLLLSGINIFGANPKRTIISLVSGGILLIITTGSILAVKQETYYIFGDAFSAGGSIGIWLKGFLLKYTNITGSCLILVLLFISGFILATGFSIVKFFTNSWFAAITAFNSIKSIYRVWKERKEKARDNVKNKTPKAKKPEIKIQPPAPKPVKVAPAPKQKVFDFMHNGDEYNVPPLNLLDEPEATVDHVDDENLKMQSRLLEKKLEDFGVKGNVMAVFPGPVITTFEYKPAPGVKINKVANLSDDLALALRAISVRIVAPIPGKAAIGIEIPNATRENVHFREIVVSDEFRKSKSNLALCLGKDIVGNPVVAEIDKMPHLLIAGATGAGKSVSLNAMISSLVYKSSPDDVKLIMVDPKRIELSVYDGIPHLITPVVTDMKKATNALFWAVRVMERRYILLAEKKVRNLQQYNRKIEKLKPSKDEDPPKKLPLIVIIIDELADLMMVASRDVEVALTRLAQMARAAGIHIILATQRPSVDVLTGIIKANFPTRISFQVSSKTDSRTILDTNGAENLLGNGDMLYMPPGTSAMQRIHGAYISEDEMTRVIDFLKKQKKPEYDEKITETHEEEKTGPGSEDYDEKYDEAVALVTKTRKASISLIQRHLRIGYNRAARIIEVMESEGIVSAADGSKPREVLVGGYDNIP